MFSIYHCIWLFICCLLIFVVFYYIRKDRLSFDRLLNICCIICILSECTKVFSVIQMAPLTNGNGFIPYLESNHLPIHLCSIQILLIFALKLLNKESDVYHKLIAFMYPTCILGAFFALLLPSIFSTTISVNQAFTHPMAYQFFIYHAMLIALGLGIYHNYKNTLTKKDHQNTIILLLTVAFVSIYANSIFATPKYENGVLVGIEHSVNFFFTYQTPINIKLNTVGQWSIYLAILLVLAIALITLLYVPVLRKKNSR